MNVRAAAVPALALLLVLGGLLAARAQDGPALPPPPPAGGPPAPPAKPGVQDALLDRLVGTWVGRGTVRGHDALEVWSVEWTLEHQFLSVESTRTTVGDAARSTFQRELFLRPVEAGYRGTAVDSAGDVLAIKATKAEDGLALDLTGAQEGAAKATWTLKAPTTLEVRVKDAAGKDVLAVTLERQPD